MQSTHMSECRPIEQDTTAHKRNAPRRCLRSISNRIGCDHAGSRRRSAGGRASIRGRCRRQTRTERFPPIDGIAGVRVRRAGKILRVRYRRDECIFPGGISAARTFDIRIRYPADLADDKLISDTPVWQRLSEFRTLDRVRAAYLVAVEPELGFAAGRQEGQPLAAMDQPTAEFRRSHRRAARPTAPRFLFRRKERERWRTRYGRARRMLNRAPRVSRPARPRP